MITLLQKLLLHDALDRQTKIGSLCSTYLSYPALTEGIQPVCSSSSIVNAVLHLQVPLFSVQGPDAGKTHPYMQ